MRTVWFADHLGAVDPFTALAAVAVAAPTLHLGTLVLNHDFWHPALLARACGTLAHLAPGRCTLGLGAGHAEVEYRALGIPYRPAAERIARLAEVVAVVRRLLDGDTVTHDTATFGLDGCTLGAAVPPSRVPILVGGDGDRVLDLAARHADTVGLVGFGAGRDGPDLSHFSWDGLVERIAHVRERAGDRMPSVNVLVQRVTVTDDPDAVLAGYVDATGMPVAFFRDTPFLLVGSAAEIRHRLERLAVLGVADVTVFEESAEDLLAATGAPGRPAAR